MTRSRSGLFARTLFVALSIGTFLATAHLVRSVLPWPASRGLQAKRAWWEEHGDRVDVVTIGSSRVARGCIPEVVQEQLATAGRPLAVFNFGVIGMAAYESDFVLRWILSTHPARLRYAIVEPESWRPDLPDLDKPLTERDVYWHDALHTWQGLRAVSLSGGDPGTRALSYLEQLNRFALRTTNAGALRRLLEQRLSGDVEPDTPSASTVALRRGWQPYGESHGPEFPNVIRLYEQLGAESPYGRLVESVRTAPSPDEALDAFDTASVDEQVDALRAAGVVPIHVIGPCAPLKPWIRALARHGHLPHLLDYQDPDRYPRLYDFGVRYDADHLNEPGAVEFSRLLGRDLADLIGRLGDEPAR